MVLGERFADCAVTSGIYTSWLVAALQIYRKGSSRNRSGFIRVLGVKWTASDLKLASLGVRCMSRVNELASLFQSQAPKADDKPLYLSSLLLSMNCGMFDYSYS